jgi:hypothetical protein
LDACLIDEELFKKGMKEWEKMEDIEEYLQ